MSLKDKEDLFAKMYDEHADALFRFFYFKVSDPDLAKDLIQDAFTRTWNHLTRGGDIDNPRAFIFTVAKRLVIDTWRKKKSIVLSRMEDAEGNPFDTADTSVDALGEADFRSILALFEKLPDDDRLLLQMRFVEDLPIKEIASILEERENTVSVRINRAVAKLRKYFNNAD